MTHPRVTPALIGPDAGDTLWQNERLFRMSHARFDSLLQPWADSDTVAAHLAQVKHRNLHVYGYGAKGFTLSMMMTALELSQGQAAASVLAEILQAGRELMQHPMEPLPCVPAALIPYPLGWSHEAAEVPTGHPRFAQFDALGALAGWLEAAGR